MISLLYSLLVKKNIQFLLSIVFCSLVSALNFDPEDWYVVKSMGNISSITEDDYLIYILADNGIFTIDKSSGDFEYNIELSDNFYDPQIIYYDKYSDFFWLITRREVYVKSSVSSYWRNLSSAELGFSYVRPIYDIGSSPSYVWLDFGTEIYPLYSYGKGISDGDLIDFSESNLIDWGEYSNGRSGKLLDISQYLIMDDWSVGLKDIRDLDGNIINPTVKLEDSNGDVWIGSQEGILLKGWRNSHRLEVLNLGPESSIVTVYEKDKYGNWWFGDSPFMRNRKIYNNSKHKRFKISHWLENENKWNYLLPTDYNELSYDINNIHKNGSFLYISTLGGLIVYDIIEDDWQLLKEKDGLRDNAVWDLEQYGNSLYIATKYGLNEVSILNNKVIPNSSNWISQFNNIEIYDIELDKDKFLIASEDGLYKVDHDNSNIVKISNRIFNTIQVVNGKVWSKNSSLWVIDDEGEIKIENKVSSFYVYNDFLWITNGKNITLMNIKTEQSWDIPLEKGIKDAQIYSLSCDEEWVWLLSDKGIIFYNWVIYNNEKN